ncbi:hypothetical protein ACE1ET_10625 [Saccharicrinis sp. FJH62]|uniref:hypothetical protein n=1 Tax=Saccharicrinis sp. FJH62 TaxID=3344657 RepID=UPI0035D4D3A1
MKTTGIICFTLWVIVALLPLNLHAENENDNEGMYAKNKMYTAIHNDLDIDIRNRFSDGDRLSNAIAATLSLSFTWFFINNSGLIAQLDYSRTLTNNESTYSFTQIARSKMLYAGYIYGYQLSQTLGLYGSAMLGIGAARDYFRYVNQAAGNNTKALLTGARLELGAYWWPILALPVLLQPRIGYALRNQANDSYNTVTSGLYMSASIIAALSCNDFYCRNSSIAKIMNPYLPGLIFITTGLNPFLQLGSITSKFTDAQNSVNNYFNTGLQLGFGIYLIQNLAALMYLNSYSNKTTQQDSDYGNRDSGFKFGVGLRYNLPFINSCLNNLYAQAKIGFGNRAYEYLNSESSTNKDKIFAYSMGIGYAYFLTSYMALTSTLLYEVNRYTNTVSSISTSYSGFAIRLALAFYISNLNLIK